MFILNFILIGLLSSLAQAADETLVSGSFGAGVVEATVSKIESACIFPDDKLFTRRLAYVESFDGAEPKTYSAGYYGGIWKVDQSMFNKTQSSAARSFLSMYIPNISKSFQITWYQVTWKDLTKPLYSALASRLYVSYQSRYESSGIPRSVESQASYWVKYYRSGVDANDFVTKASSLERLCRSAGADIVFLLDGSGSIGSENFLKMQKFAKDVVNSFNVGQYRFGLIQFSNDVQREFDLKTYSTAESINAAIDRVAYIGGGTNTMLGLDEMRMNGFLESNGARLNNHPRVGIVLTDGVSNDPQATIKSALETQNAGISLIAVGIGLNLDMTELNAIASDPDCLNLILLEGFLDISSLHSIIEKRTCAAPIDVKNGNIELPPGGDQNCKINITNEGVTIELMSLNNATTRFYVSRSSYPSASYYDDMIEASMGHMGLMFIENLFKNGSFDSIFCNIKAGNTSTNVSIGLKSGNHDVCKKLNPCLNGGSCENQPGGTYTCNCPSGFSGVNCERYHFISDTDVCKNSNPCLNGGSCENQPERTYICNCPFGFSGVNCEHASNYNNVGTYNCEDRNPCTNANVIFYFANDDPTKFVQCSSWGSCYVMPCPPGFKWDQNVMTCLLA